MIIAEWTGWSDMADSFFGGSQCKKGYGIEFYVSRDGGATHQLIQLESDTDPHFTHDIPSQYLDTSAQVFDNPEGKLIFRQANDVVMHSGEWRIYYKLFLYDQECEKDDNGDCVVECKATSANCIKNNVNTCQAVCNEDCTSKPFFTCYNKFKT